MTRGGPPVIHTHARQFEVLEAVRAVGSYRTRDAFRHWVQCSACRTRTRDVVTSARETFPLCFQCNFLASRGTGPLIPMRWLWGKETDVERTG